jgi:glutamate synthase domain-containing protein 1
MQNKIRTGYVDKRDEYPALPNYGAQRPPGLEYIMSGCGIAGTIDVSGARMSGENIGRMLTTMSERENGLGAGYSAYGLFEGDLKNAYCLQFFFDDEKAMSTVEEYLKNRGEIIKEEKVFTKKVPTMRPPYPIIWRYFFNPNPRSEKFRIRDQEPDECVVDIVMGINGVIPGAICISSGKDMAVFKGNGYSYEIADYFDLGRYSAPMWLSHSRFPTNTPGWWAGAHPISLLDWSVCHNGEITSYGVNRKFVEMNGYKCSLLTDTEVVAYLWDLMVRRHKLPMQAAGFALAPWYHNEIQRLDPKSKDLATQLRITYKEAFLNGPFSILVGRSQPEITMIAMADRKKLRPLLFGQSEDGKRLYAASEECAVRIVEKDTAETWVGNPGSPFIAKVGEGIVRRGTEEPFKGVFC